MAHLKADKAPTKVSHKYTNFEDVFSQKLAAEDPDHTNINNYAIELIDDQQSSYRPIYSLDQWKLKILKTYTKNNLTNGFI